MGVEGCGKCIKFSMFAANVLTMIGAVTVFAIGVWTLLDHSELRNFLGTNLYKSSASILIAMGVIVMLITFLGCFGAIREIKCMLITYFIILFLIFIVLLIGGVLAYVFRDKVEATLRTQMMRSAKKYGDADEQGKVITGAWDSAQRNFKCCGISKVTDPTDEYSYRVWKTNLNVNPGLPPSCCNVPAKCGNKTMPANPRSFYKLDCLTRVTTYFKGHARILGGVGVGISSIMVFGMIFSYTLFKLIE